MDVNQKLRSQRMASARAKGSHSIQEWQQMKDFFEDTCAKCLGTSGLINVERDHIIPIYQGGSDAINNIQPLCALCNSQKGPENKDWRPELAKFLNKDLPMCYTIGNQL